MNELILSEQMKVNYTLPTITLDIKQLTETVSALKEQYSNWVVSENDIDAAKDTVAQLNKVSKAISDERIRIAKLIKSPIDEMENSLKELTSTVKGVSDSIKTYLNDYEQNRRDNLTSYYKSLPDWEDYMTFEDRWLNKTTKEIVVINEMKNQRSQHDRDRETIKKFAEGKLETERYFEMQDTRHDLNDILGRMSEDYELLNKSQVPTEKDVTSEKTRVYTVTCEEHTHELIKEFFKEMNVEWK